MVARKCRHSCGCDSWISGSLTTHEDNTNTHPNCTDDCNYHTNPTRRRRKRKQQQEEESSKPPTIRVKKDKKKHKVKVSITVTESYYDTYIKSILNNAGDDA